MTRPIVRPVALSAAPENPPTHRADSVSLSLTTAAYSSARSSARARSAAALRQLQTRLTERDEAVLSYVSGLRFVSGGQLTRLCFADGPNAAANGRAARRALLRLTRLGVLERLPRTVGGVRAGSAGFVYRLGGAGYRLAVLRGWQPERTRRRSLVPGTLFLRHTLLIAELHTRLIEGERSGSFELLALDAEPACWRSIAGAQFQRLKPDSYVRLGLGPYEDSYFIEVDRGTEGSRAIDGQLGRYAAYHRAGIEQAERGVFPLVLWLTPERERVAVIERCVRELPEATHALFRVATFDEAVAVMASAEANPESLGSIYYQ